MPRLQIIFLVLLLFAGAPATPSTFQPELILQKGHTRSVVAVAISPDHRWLASGSQDSTIKIWSLPDGMLLRTLYGHSGKINAVAISHDAQWIASAGEDNKVRLWGISTGNAAYIMSGFSSPPTSVVFTNDNKFLLASNSDSVKIFECASGHEIRSVAFKDEDRGGRSLLSSDGRLAVIGGKSGSKEGFRPYKIIDLSNGHELAKIDIDIQAPFASLAFSPDGRLLALRSSSFESGENHEAIKIFDSYSGKQKSILQIPGKGAAAATGSIAFSPDGKLIAAETELKENITVSVYVFDAATGRSIRELTTGAFFTPLINFDVMHVITAPLAFSPDSQLLALGGGNSIQMWETNSGKLLQPLRTNIKAGAISGTLNPQMAEALKGSGMTEENAQEMRMDSGEIVDSMIDPDSPMSQAMNFARQIAGAMNTGTSTTSFFQRSLAFSGNGKWLISQRSQEVRIWDLVSGTYLQLPLGASGPIAVSRDGRYIAETEEQFTKTPSDATKELVIRDASTFTLRSHVPQTSPPDAIVFAPDGNSLICLNRNNGSPGIQIIESSTGSLLHSYSLPGQVVPDKAIFSSNGRFLAVGGTQFASTTSMFPMPMPGMKISKKDAKKMQEQLGKTVMQIQKNQAEMKYEIDLIDVQSGRELSKLLTAGQSLKLMNSPEQVSFPGVVGETSIVFSPDGSLIAILNSEQNSSTVKIYETASGHQLATIPVSGKPAITFSPDNKALAITSQQDQYAINITRIPDGATIRVLPQSGRADQVAFSPDGRFLVSTMQDETRILWNAATGEKLATLVEFPGINFTTEWLVTTPSGLFDGSPDAFQQILWRFSSNTFDVAPMEAFFNEFYYPGLLGAIFSGRKPAAPRDISQIDRRQPDIHIAGDFNGELNTREVNVRIEINDAGSGARDLRLFRNGSLVKVWHGDLLQNGEKNGAVEARIPFVAGENRIVAYAFSNANIKSRDSIVMIRGAEALRRPAVAHIIAIGINQYSNPDFNLKFAVPDAQSFGDTLKNALTSTGKYESVDVQFLLDADATKEKILQALQQMKEIKPEDSVFVYYAGHGTAEGARFYIVPQELHYTGARDALDSTAMKAILDGSISDLDLANAFEQIDSSQILLVIDACNSGQALESPENRFSLMNSKGLAQLAYEKGMYVLAAAQGYQAAVEAAELGHGFLTYVLVEEGLKTAAADTEPHDGEVRAREWLDYSTVRVPQMQSAKMREQRLLKHEVAFVAGEEKIEDVEQRSVQRPRVFYRREASQEPFLIAKPKLENQ